MLRKILIAVLLSFLLTGLLNHSGRTDSQGGHWDTETGEYHYHHGHLAHQHPNGVCPYGDYNPPYDSGSYGDDVWIPPVKKTPVPKYVFPTPTINWRDVIKSMPTPSIEPIKMPDNVLNPLKDNPVPTRKPTSKPVSTKGDNCKSFGDFDAGTQMFLISLVGLLFVGLCVFFTFYKKGGR